GEIMTIALASIPAEDTLWMKALILFVVAIGITAAVYGFVALIVKADDFGLHLASRGTGPLAALGRGIVKFMPAFMKVLTIVGTAAMIWVGGQIILHGLGEMGWHGPYDWVHHQAEAAAHAVQQFAGIVQWAVTAFFDGVFGLILGLLLIPVVEKVINPLLSVTVTPLIGAVKGMFSKA